MLEGKTNVPFEISRLVLLGIIFSLTDTTDFASPCQYSNAPLKKKKNSKKLRQYKKNAKCVILIVFFVKNCFSERSLVLLGVFRHSSALALSRLSPWSDEDMKTKK